MIWQTARSLRLDLPRWILTCCAMFLVTYQAQAQENSVDPSHESQIVYGGQTFKIPLYPGDGATDPIQQKAKLDFASFSEGDREKFLEYRRSTLRAVVDSLATVDMFGSFNSDMTTSQWWQHQKILSEEAPYFEKTVSPKMVGPFEFILNKINSQVWQQTKLIREPTYPVTFVTLTLSLSSLMWRKGFYRFIGLGILSEPLNDSGRMRRTLFLLSDKRAANSPGAAVDVNLALRLFKGQKTSESTPLEAIKGVTTAFPGPLMLYSGPEMRATGLSMATNVLATLSLLVAGGAGPDWITPSIRTAAGYLGTSLEILGKVSYVQTQGSPRELMSWESSENSWPSRVLRHLTERATKIYSTLSSTGGLCTLHLN